MTATVRRVSLSLVAALVGFVLMFVAVQIGVSVAGAQSLDAGAVAVEPFDAGPAVDAGPVAAPVEPAPADKLSDPLTNPVGAYDDLKAAKRIGWGAAFLVLLISVCSLLGRLGGILAPLGTPRVLLAIGSVGTFAATSYNAVALGGAWLAALSAAIPPLIVAMIKVWQWDPKATEPTT